MSITRTRRVLVVDDEPDMADWLATVVARAGYETRVATRGAEAEELFAAWLPDAALVDLVLPDVSGAELVGRLKNLQPRTEVLVISGQGSIPRAVEAIKAGASYFLEKPIDADSVVALVDAGGRLGVGDWRPSSPKSATGIYGQYKVEG